MLKKDSKRKFIVESDGPKTLNAKVQRRPVLKETPRGRLSYKVWRVFGAKDSKLKSSEEASAQKDAKTRAPLENLETTWGQRF